MINSKEIDLDKQRIKDVVLSLRNANREILKLNNINSFADDFIYLTLVMEKPIIPQSDT
jgi:hypothetical protein